MEMGLCRANRRIIEIDIIKALGIICVVIGHSGSPLTDFIYLFHMAIFFMASGFCYKKVNPNFVMLLSYIKRKIKSLWVPLFVWNAIFVFLHNFFININVYTDNPRIFDYVSGTHIGTTVGYNEIDIFLQLLKGFLFWTSEEIFGASWFLRILFIVIVGYVLVDYICLNSKNNYIIQSLISVLFLMAGYLCSIKNYSFHGLEDSLSCYCLYHIGVMLRYYHERVVYSKRMALVNFFISLSVLIYLNKIGTISLGNNRYENPLFLLLSSLAGWILLMSVSIFLKDVKCTCLLQLIGKRTISILILHFLAFKIVALGVVLYYKIPIFCVAAFPNLYGERGGIWIIYSLIGVIVPICISLFYEKTKYILRLFLQLIINIY